MTRTDFYELLLKATAQVLEFTREFVWNPIPDTVQYRVHPNMSYDRRPDGSLLTTYPEDPEIADGFTLFTDASEVATYLWRDAGVPQWIDVKIEEAHEFLTTIELVCCGRYTTDEEAMYYSQWGMGPFGVKGPSLPPGWRSGEANEKFDLFWIRNKRESGG